LEIIAKIGVGMLIGAAVVAVPIALNLPESWLGGVIVLALAGNGVVLLVNSAKASQSVDHRVTSEKNHAPVKDAS
jgi:hypothetical protein